MKIRLLLPLSKATARGSVPSLTRGLIQDLGARKGLLQPSLAVLEASDAFRLFSLSFLPTLPPHVASLPFFKILIDFNPAKSVNSSVLSGLADDMRAHFV